MKAFDHGDYNIGYSLAQGNGEAFALLLLRLGRTDQEEILALTYNTCTIKDKFRIHAADHSRPVRDLLRAHDVNVNNFCDWDERDGLSGGQSTAIILGSKLDYVE